MKILHYGYSDQIGGAAKASYRLHQSLLQAGADSEMLVGHKCTKDPRVHEPSGLGKLWQKITPKLDSLPLKLSRGARPFSSTAWVGADLSFYENLYKPQVNQLHWLGAGFARLESLARLQRPVVWRLADAWAMAGAEHYAGASKRFIEGYDKTSGSGGFDVDRWVWNRKVKVFPQIKNLTVVTPSKWLAECARQSLLLRNRRIEVIPTGHNIQSFSPADKTAARKKLGLPLDKKLILFGAADATKDPRKGFGHFEKALDLLSTQDVVCVVFGGSDKNILSHSKIKTYSLGWFDPSQLSDVYNAADVFVASSVEENLANTVIEAMACGIPVVAFSIGGMPDVITHQKDGFLVNQIGAVGLSEGIQWVLADQARWKGLSQHARRKILDGFTLELQAQRYIKLYEDILS